MSKKNKSEKPEKPRKPKKKISAGRIFKWSLILAFIVFCMLTALNRIGGDSPVMREGLEQVFTDKTGYRAQIKTFNKMTFFPLVAIDAEDIYFYEIPDPPLAEDETPSEGVRDEPAEGRISQPLPEEPPVMTVRKLHFAIGFFDMLLGKSRIRHFALEGLQASPGALLEQKVEIERAYINDAGGEEAANFNVSGAIGDQPLEGIFSLTTFGMDRYRSYSIGDSRNFTLKSGDLELGGTLNNKVLGGMTLEKSFIRRADQKILEGDFEIDSADQGQWKITGKAALYPHGTILAPDISLGLGTPLTVKGKLESEKLILGDVEDGSLFRESIDQIANLLSGKKEGGKIDLADLEIDLQLDAKEVRDDKLLYGSVITPLKITENRLNIGPLDGKISDGDLGGTIVLHAEKSPAQLDVDITLKQMDYGALQKQTHETAEIDGRADIALRLNAKAATYDTLFQNAEGKMSFVTGDAEMKSKILDLWGGGLLNALLPDFSGNEMLQVTCGVVDVDIKNQKALTNALFIDTPRVKVSGEGEYDIANNRLNLKLAPKTKDVSLIDVGTGVHVQGAIESPKITPSAMDIGKKIGGLLMGAVNPAFYAVTLVDLGLTDRHPCKKYIIEKEELADPTQNSSGSQPVTP